MYRWRMLVVPPGSAALKNSSARTSKPVDMSKGQLDFLLKKEHHRITSFYSSDERYEREALREFVFEFLLVNIDSGFIDLFTAKFAAVNFMQT